MRTHRTYPAAITREVQRMLVAGESPIHIQIKTGIPKSTIMSWRDKESKAQPWKKPQSSSNMGPTVAAPQTDTTTSDNHHTEAQEPTTGSSSANTLLLTITQLKDHLVNLAGKLEELEHEITTMKTLENVTKTAERAIQQVQIVTTERNKYQADIMARAHQVVCGEASLVSRR